MSRTFVPNWLPTRVASLKSNAPCNGNGLDTVRAYMRHVQDNAAACMREAIERLRPGAFRYEMDQGAVIAVRVEIDRATRRGARRFHGTSAQDAHNFNAPRAVLHGGRVVCLSHPDRQADSAQRGLPRALDITIPRGSMLDPGRRPPSRPETWKPHNASSMRSMARSAYSPHHRHHEQSDFRR